MLPADAVFVCLSLFFTLLATLLFAAAYALYVVVTLPRHFF